MRSDEMFDWKRKAPAVCTAAAGAALAFVGWETESDALLLIGLPVGLVGGYWIRSLMRRDARR